jgi:hypothetical protein
MGLVTPLISFDFAMIVEGVSLNTANLGWQTLVLPGTQSACLSHNLPPHVFHLGQPSLGPFPGQLSCGAALGEERQAP